MDISTRFSLKDLWTMGVTEEQLSGLDVLVLPENIGESGENPYDAQDSITLSKMLKGAGVKCANSYDLSLDVPTKERRSSDIWIGQLYILNDGILPILTGVIGSLLANCISDWKKKKDQPSAPKANVHAEVSIIRPDGIVKISYSGDPETFIKVIKNLDKGHGESSD